MNQCPTQEELSRFLSGVCAVDEAESIESHLESCESCCERCMHSDGEGDPLLSQLRGVLDHEEQRKSSGAFGPDLSGRDHTDLEPANVIDVPGFQVKEEIGRGGMGAVFRAVQKSTRREVALKVLLAGQLASPVARQRFQREVELAASLQHPNIVTVLESGVAEQHCYFAMELVDGTALDKHLVPGESGVRDTARLFVKVCRAINHAHQRGVIHRDLKPSNVMVTSDGEPQILDFGLAKFARPREGDPARLLSMPGELMGTLPYMSPEQVSGDHYDIDVRSDIYTLGVMLYRLLTGRYPYTVTGGAREVLERITSEPPFPPSRLRRDVPQDLQTITLTALAKDRERRYQTAGDLADDLQRYLDGEPIAARRDSTSYVIARLARKHKIALTVTGLVVVLATLSGISWWNYTIEATRTQVRQVLEQVMSAPEAARAAIDAASADVKEQVTGSLGEYVESGSAQFRQIGTHGAALTGHDAFWEGIDGGALWRNGEWLELIEQSIIDDRFIDDLDHFGESGTERQQYVALCLAGAVPRIPDTTARRLIELAAQRASHPGVMAAAAWAARQRGIAVNPRHDNRRLSDPITGLIFCRLPDSLPEQRGPADNIWMADTEVTWPLMQRYLDSVDNVPDAAEITTRMENHLRSPLFPREKAREAAAGFWTPMNAERLCAWLNDLATDTQPRRTYRLPTEDEWKYAAHAGNDAAFSYGNDPKYARYFGNLNGNSLHWHVVAQHMPNFFGIYDLHGGLWEVCDTRVSPDRAAEFGLAGQELWITHGGATYSPAIRCRVDQQNFLSPLRATDYNGVRLVMEMDAP